MDFLALKPISFLSPSLQIGILALLFVAMVLYQYRHSKKTGKMYSVYPVSVSPLLAPIYEEIIFRGFILFGLLTIYPLIHAAVISSLLFGLWHLKNIFWEGPAGVIKQMAYAGLIIGPILTAITIWSGTIWLAVIVHYLNNLWAPISKDLYSRLVLKRTA